MQIRYLAPTNWDLGKKLSKDAFEQFCGKMYEGLFVAGLFINIIKAFDFVDHNILMNKLWERRI